jgi:hypothetical protein
MAASEKLMSFHHARLRSNEPGGDEQEDVDDQDDGFGG